MGNDMDTGFTEGLECRGFRFRVGLSVLGFGTQG